MIYLLHIMFFMAGLFTEDAVCEKHIDTGVNTCYIFSNEVKNYSCPDPDITFFLFTKKNPDVPERIIVSSTPKDSNLDETSFNPRNPVKIMIHGFKANMSHPDLVRMKDQYLRSRDFNIFSVDWSPLANQGFSSTLKDLKHVGACTSQLVQRIREFGIDDIHVIGFSFGAHVSGHLANYLRPYKLPRITGLDPAGPCFFFPPESNDKKLDKGDALFVDIVHTSMPVGYFGKLGHVDFYLNGGILQFPCFKETLPFKWPKCFHERSATYFAESINSKTGFWGWRLSLSSFLRYLVGMKPTTDPQIIMGEHVDSTAVGRYFVKTRLSSPYASGRRRNN